MTVRSKWIAGILIAVPVFILTYGSDGFGRYHYRQTQGQGAVVVTVTDRWLGRMRLFIVKASEFSECYPWFFVR